MATDANLPQLRYGDEYLRPERDSYTFTNPDGSRRTSTSGGPMFIETDHLGGPFTVSVVYSANTQAKVRFFQMFYLRQTLEGSIPFQCALALESSEIFEDYVVRFTEAPVWNTMTGYYGKVSCSFEVEQRVVDDYELEDNYFDLMQEYGDDLSPFLNYLEYFANTVMDQSIPAEE